MKRKNVRRIIWTAISVIVLTVSFILFYWPFVQVNDIDAEEYLGGRLDDSWYDRKLELRLRLELYPLSRFIHKGDVYADIPLLYGNCDMRKMTIKFNWDNSITISERKNIYTLHITRVVIGPNLFPLKPKLYPDVYDSDDYYPLKHHETDDSLLVGVFMYDKNDNGIGIYRQKSMKPFGGRRNGFFIKIKGKEGFTGKESPFDY